MRLPAREVLVVDDEQVPVGARSVAKYAVRPAPGSGCASERFDDGFTGLVTTDGRGSAEVRTPAGGAQLWFDETFRFLQVFTVDALTAGPAGRRDRTDDLRAGCVQFRRGTDCPGTGWFVAGKLGRRPGLITPGWLRLLRYSALGEAPA